MYASSSLYCYIQFFHFSATQAVGQTMFRRTIYLPIQHKIEKETSRARMWVVGHQSGLQAPQLSPPWPVKLLP